MMDDYIIQFCAIYGVVSFALDLLRVFRGEK